MKYVKLYESFELNNVSREEFYEKISKFNYDSIIQSELNRIKDAVNQNKGITNITPLELEYVDRGIIFAAIGNLDFLKPKWHIILHKLEDEWYTIEERPEGVFGLSVFYIIDGLEDLLKYLLSISEKEIIDKQTKIWKSQNMRR